MPFLLQEEEKEGVLQRLEHAVDTHPDDSSLHFDLVVHPEFRFIYLFYWKF